MNKKQKQFINTLNKSIEQAISARDIILEAFTHGIGNNESNREYLREVQAYIKAAEKMRTAVIVGFGKPASTIAAETLVNENGN